MLFYPDAPFFFPPRLSKLLPSLALLAAVRLLLLLRGRKLLVDVADIPRWQFITLHRKLQVSPRVSRLFESCFFRLADKVCLAGNELASWLSRDLGIPRERFAVMPHLPPQPTPSRKKDRDQDLIKFVYVGGLSEVEDRGIIQLLKAFMKEDPTWAVLYLAGEDGDWIPRRFDHPRIVYRGLLTESDCIALIQECDFGLIPYPEWGYYRTVLPTKLALYESCGVKVISTALPEVLEWTLRGGDAQIRPYREFAHLFRTMPPE